MNTAGSVLGLTAIVSLATYAPHSAAIGQTSVVDAEVVDVQPVVAVVTERIPVESCRPERVFIPERARFASLIPTAVGALIGGTVGNVLGRNSSKRGIITGAGAVLGGTVGYQRDRRVNGDRGYYVTEDVCVTVYEERESERIDGYRVRYRFGDTVYQTETDDDPGSTIAVRVSLEPLE